MVGENEGEEEGGSSQTNERALGDFLVFLSRIASAPKIRNKLTSRRWTRILLKMVGHEPDTGIISATSYGVGICPLFLSIFVSICNVACSVRSNPEAFCNLLYSVSWHRRSQWCVCVVS